MRILLIEDNNDHAVLCNMALMDEHSVEVVNTLGGGLDRLSGGVYDAVLSDLSLPDAGGTKVVKQIRNAAPATPLVVLTSLNCCDLEDEVIAAGALDYLYKAEVLTDTNHARMAIQRALRHASFRQHALDEKEALLAELRDSQLQLQQQNKRLEGLCQTAQTFVDNVSHEFRTPLTVIREYASLIREGVVGGVNPQQEDMLNVVEDRSDDLNNMVDDMLDGSRLEAGLVFVRRKELSIAGLFERTMPPLMRKAEVRKIDLQVDLPDDLPNIWGDAEKLSRVLINLVVNAIKFCGQPGVVTIRVAHDPVAQEVEVTVSDNGPGIPAEQSQLIFERFSQPVTNARQSTKGFGLGLGIAKELVDLNLGQMSVKSVEGQGSTFGFTVPLADPQQVLDRHLKRLKATGYSGMIGFIEVRSDCDGPNDRQDLEKLIEMQLFRNDQLFAVAPGRWVAVIAAASFERSTFRDRLITGHARQTRNRPRGPLPAIEVETIGHWGADEANFSEIGSAFDHLLNRVNPSRETKKEVAGV